MHNQLIEKEEPEVDGLLSLGVKKKKVKFHIGLIT